MFRNYFKISWRSLVKNRAYAFINITGLALSMACCILIFTIVSYHTSFDNFHANSNRIYRFVTEQHRDVTTYAGSVPPAFGKAYRTDYTFSEQTANLVTFHGAFITIDEGQEVKKFKEPEGVAFTETGYFDIFNFPFVQGNKNLALTQPNSVVITQRVAEKYFGKQNPMGRIIKLDNSLPLTVSGVLKDIPANTDLRSEIYVSFPTMKAYNSWYAADDSWGGISTELQCFTRLKQGIAPAEVEKFLPAYVKKYRAKARNIHHYLLQPIADMHFDARYGGVMEKKNLWILSFIGLFIIITACVNFINLATAQALKRSKEVGVRKVLGGMRSQLFWQFIIETALITIIGIAVAITLAVLLMPYANTLFKTQMSIHIYDDRLLLFTIVLAAIITFLAGSYPGLVLARFRPVVALKGKISQQNIGGFNTRRALIITQFAISQMLIIGMIVIGFQMRYAKTSDLGFNKDAVVMIPIGADTTGTTINTFKALSSHLAGVQNVTSCYAAPSAGQNWNTSFRFEHDAEDEVFSLGIRAGDADYVPTFGLDLVAGRNLYPSDTVRECLVNETFAKKMNVTDVSQLLAKTITFNGTKRATIVGIVKDFHDASFHSDIKPICISTYKSQYNNYAVKINMNNAKTVLPALEKAWSSVYPNQIYSYQFLDDSIAEFYETEQTMLNLVQVFALIAIFIGCLGLYGLVMFMAVQKTKEIGIRKVLGSTVSQILWIFGKEFARLILIAFLIASPAAWLLMSGWLENFKYRINISPLYFVMTIVLMFVIAAVTVGYHAVRAAFANPVKSLRTE